MTSWRDHGGDSRADGSFHDLHHGQVPGTARGRRRLAGDCLPFTQATRSEPGCLWFDWSRSLDDPTEYVLVEAFRDGDAGGAHVQSAHFKDAQQTLPPHLAQTPKIVNFTIEQDDWSELGEMAVPGS